MRKNFTAMFIRIDEAIHSDIKETSYQFEGQDEFLYFGPTDTVNIFVGANNSGKSRFLRGLIKSKGINFVNNNTFQKIIQNIENTINQIKPVYSQLGVESLGRFRYSIDTRSNFFGDSHKWLVENKGNKQSYYEVRFSTAYFDELYESIFKMWFTNEDFFSKLVNEKVSEISIVTEIIIQREKINQSDLLRGTNINILEELLLPKNESLILLEHLKELLNIHFQPALPISKYYIPILRTANTLLEKTATISKKITSNIFEHTTSKNYEFDNCGEKDIIIYHTGLDLYQKIQKTRNSRKDIRNNFSEFEKFLSQNFFHGKEVDIVALSEDSEENQHISIYLDNADRHIHQLGDGIQAIILLMYPIFTAKNESWVFIEEPEINLHPSLQRIFLEQILKNEVIKKKNLKFFFTTHSNHLLDISLGLEEGVSIFTFEKRSKDEENAIFKIKNVKSQDTDILRLLGVNNSSVFMANCSIWVEGICDRLYIRAYLEAYTKHHKIKTNFKEDIHFAFFEYAGSNVAHYFFDEPEELENLPEDEKSKIKSQFLSNKIFLLADQDSGKDQKHTSLLEQQNKNFQYYCLKVREIENLLSPEQLNKLLPKINKKIDAQTLSSKKIKHEDYKTEYLGKFIKNKLKGIDLGKFEAKSGTLSTYYKNKLSEEASQDIQWDEMSDEAKALAEAVYQFIKNSNPAY